MTEEFNFFFLCPGGNFSRLGKILLWPGRPLKGPAYVLYPALELQSQLGYKNLHKDLQKASLFSLNKRKKKAPQTA